MPPGVCSGVPTGPGGLPRRTLLAAAGLTGALAACSGSDGAEEGTAAGLLSTEEADRLRRDTARRGGELLARYEATARVHLSLGETLTPFLEAVTAHQVALGGPAGVGTSGAQGASAAGPEVPAEPADAVTALINAERRVADQRYRELADAPPELARLLASLAAAGSAHAYLLGQARP